MTGSELAYYYDLKDKHGGDMGAWPPDFDKYRVREFPQVGSVQAKTLGLHHPHGGDPREWPYEVMTRLYQREWPRVEGAAPADPLADPLAGRRERGRAF